MSQKVDLGNKVMIVDSSSVCYIIHNYYVKIFHDYVNISYKVIKNNLLWLQGLCNC